MSDFICYKCNQNFKQKIHLKNHLDKKKSCQKCNNGFETNWAYINGDIINVCNAPSPAATSSLNIGKYIVDISGERF